MKMRGLGLCLVVVSTMAVSTGRAADPPAFFPLMAYNAPPDDPAVLRKMRECGLTVAGFVAPSGLDRCRDAGLKAIVYDARIANIDWAKVEPDKVRESVAAVVDATKNHPAVLGYLLRDEPPASFFPGLRAVADLIRERSPGAWPYINLLPNYASPDQLGTPDYATYLERFIADCRPPILSYDHYAMMEGGGLRPGYFGNLDAMRKAAKAHDLPFWNIVLSVAHFNYREPTDADLRFQVYTSLAYGARGLSYFTYLGSATGNYRRAPIDAFGNETPTWRSLRDVNLQVAQLAPTLLKLRSDRVYHFGAAPQECAGPDDRSLVKAIDGPILVGDFTHEEGSSYVLVVNRDVSTSVPGLPQFRNPPAKVEKVSPLNGQLVPFSGEEIWLAPGQGALLKLTR